MKDGYAAFGRGDIQGLLALFAEDIEWISPGEGLPLAGTYRGHAAVADFFQKLSEMVESSSLEPREFVKTHTVIQISIVGAAHLPLI